MHPYENLPPERYWRTGVAEVTPASVKNLYRKRFPILPEDRIATAGSCFAQHVAKEMRDRGFCLLDAEPPPAGLSNEIARSFGYGLYSARYGNIYTARQLLQLLHDTRGRTVRDGDIWSRDGRYFDALRPTVEPNGFSSMEEVRQQRISHLTRLEKLFRQTDLFVFTLGLTEAWINRETGIAYPTAPGVVAGEYEAALYSFHNFHAEEVYSDLVSIRERLREWNSNVRMLLTVSPVPLTATASESHVLNATVYSKSVLRAAAGRLYETFDDVDYFPSYELVASHFSRGALYEDNLRSVKHDGVSAVMDIFFSEHGSPAATPGGSSEQQVDAVCEDELLEAFA